MLAPEFAYVGASDQHMYRSQVPSPGDDPAARRVAPATAAVVTVPLGPEAPTRAGVWAAILTSVHRAGLLPDEALYRAVVALAGGSGDSGDIARAALAQVSTSLGLTVIGPVPETARAAVLRDAREAHGVSLRFDRPATADTALERALRAGDLAEADRVAWREHPFTSPLGGRLTRLEPSDLREYPMLALRAGVAMYARDQTRGRADAYFTVATRSGSRIGELTEPVPRAVAHAVMSMAHRRLGDNERMLHHTHRAVEVLEPIAIARRATGQEAEAVAMGLDQAGISLYLGGDGMAARRVFEALAVHAAAAELPVRINRAQALLALLDAVEGRMNSTEQRLLRIDPSAWPEGWDGSHLAKPAHIAKASLLTSRADPMGALEVLRLVESDYPTADFWGPMHVIRLTAAGLAEDEQLMARFVQDAEAHPGPRLPRTAASMDLGHAIISGLAPHIAAPRPPYAARSEAARAISALALVRTRPAAAAEAAAGIENGMPAVQIFVLLVRFLAAREQDRPAAAAEVAALANHHGLWSPFAMLTAPERELLRALAPEGALAEFDHYRTRALTGQGDVVLTEGEHRVLAALATGASRPEMARDLHLSLNTVKSHLRALYLKLGVTTRDQALQRARSLGLMRRHG